MRRKLLLEVESKPIYMYVGSLDCHVVFNYMYHQDLEYLALANVARVVLGLELCGSVSTPRPVTLLSDFVVARPSLMSCYMLIRCLRLLA